MHSVVAGKDLTGLVGGLNRSPSDLNDVVDNYSLADTDVAEQAVAAAAEAQAAWARTSPNDRFRILDTAGAELEARAGELGRVLAREEGKTLEEATGEVQRAGAVFRFHAGQAYRTHGRVTASLRPGVEVIVEHRPVGVVTVITPWNFPLAIPSWKIAPALVYGNSVVFKPAELVPSSAWALVDILHRAGLPSGVLNLVIGKGSVVAPALVSAPEVKAVSFTGSTSVGRGVLAQAQSNGARVQLEMGGKNPLVVLDDADLGTAVLCAIEGSFGCTGQRCTASSRLIVTAGIHDRFLDALIEATGRIRVGNSLDPSTDMGPIVDERQLNEVQRYLAVARSEGAEIVGGERVEPVDQAFFLSPTLVLNTTQEATINNEEVFGPVASVIRVDDFEEALAVANGVEFGLTAGIVTSSLAAAMDFRALARAGVTMLNLPTAGIDFHVPFGGLDASSYGPREQGEEAIYFFTETSTAYVSRP